MKLKYVIMLATLFSSNVFAATIPPVWIKNYVHKPVYRAAIWWGSLGDTPREACELSRSSDGFYGVWNAGKCNVYKNGRPWYEEIPISTAYQCVNGDKADFDQPNNSVSCKNKGWDACPAGYELHQISAVLMVCHRPDDGCERDPAKVEEYKLLAAIAYGESKNGASYEEMQAIAAATLRRKDGAHASSTNELIIKKKKFAYVTCNGNMNYNKLLCANSQDDFKLAYEAAKSAIGQKEDYSKGGCFWDGADLKTSGARHDKYVNGGFKFSDPSHNIYGAAEPPPKNKKGQFGKYDYAYISTAAQGGTIFWKYTDEYMKATRAKQCV